jgi:peroxiredoxin
MLAAPAFLSIALVFSLPAAGLAQSPSESASKDEKVEAWLAGKPQSGDDSLESVSCLGAEAIPSLARALGMERLNQQKVRIIDAFRVLLSYDGTESSGSGSLAREHAVPALRRVLYDKSGWVRAKSLNTLRYMGPWARDAVPDLISIVQNKHDPDEANFSTRDFAALALGAIHEQDQTPAVLVDALRDDDLKLRRAAVSALATMSFRAKSVAQQIAEAIPANDAEFAERARGALEEIGRPPPPLVGDPIPDFELPFLGGASRVRLPQYRGRVVALDFWSITCPPCQLAMAKLNKLAADHAEWADRVALIGVSVDDEKTAAKNHALKAGWTSLELLWDADRSVHRHFRASLPELILVDPAGVIKWRGHPNDISLEKEITALLSRSPSKR